MKKEKVHRTFYIISGVIGLILFMLEIPLYRMTVIPFKIPFLVTILSTIAGFLIIRNNYKKIYGKKSPFFSISQSLISFGFLACYLFMSLNYYLADKMQQSKSINILTKHTIGTKNRQPAVEINYEGTKKQLVFSNDQQFQLDTSKQVVLNVRKGLFGFDVFTEIQLK